MFQVVAISTAMAAKEVSLAVLFSVAHEFFKMDILACYVPYQLFHLDSNVQHRSVKFLRNILSSCPSSLP